MTDDNDVLAAQVEDLRGAVERCQAIVTAWDARLEMEGIGGTMMLPPGGQAAAEPAGRGPGQASAQTAARAVVARG